MPVTPGSFLVKTPDSSLRKRFSGFLPGVSWRSLPYTCCLPRTPAEAACQARSRRRRGEWVRAKEVLRVEPALLAGYAGVYPKVLNYSDCIQQIAKL